MRDEKSTLTFVLAAAAIGYAVGRSPAAAPIGRTLLLAGRIGELLLSGIAQWRIAMDVVAPTPQLPAPQRALARRKSATPKPSRKRSLRRA